MLSFAGLLQHMELVAREGNRREARASKQLAAGVGEGGSGDQARISDFGGQLECLRIAASQRLRGGTKRSAPLGVLHEQLHARRAVDDERAVRRSRVDAADA